METQNQSLQPIGSIGTKYDILLELSSSGVEGVVYLVKERTSNIEYAAKIPKDNKYNLNNEIKMLKILKQNNCRGAINIIGDGEDEITINGKKLDVKQYLILEFAQNRALGEYIYIIKKGFGEVHAKIIFYKILKCIQSIHELNICHRDIKFDNILFDENFNPKINDFGHAIYYNPKIYGNCGTKYFNAPEIIEKKEYDGYKIDIFSLGATLFGLTVGSKGFIEAKKNDKYYCHIYNQDKDNYWKVYKQKISNMILSDEFKELFLSMVSYNPDKRPNIKDILEHKWFGKIPNMNEEELEAYEQEVGLNEELVKRKDIILQSITPKYVKKEEVGENKQKTKALDDDNQNIFDNSAEPEIIKRVYFMNYYIEIQGFFDPVNFMNSLYQQILRNEDCFIESSEDTNKLELDVTFEKEEESSEEEELSMKIILYQISKKEHYLRFLRNNMNKYDFVEKFINIKKYVHNLIE